MLPTSQRALHRHIRELEAVRPTDPDKMPMMYRPYLLKASDPADLELPDVIEDGVRYVTFIIGPPGIDDMLPPMPEDAV